MDNLYETVTQNEHQEATAFREYAEIFYNTNQLEMFGTAAEADAVLTAADGIAGTVKGLGAEGEERDVRMLMLGSIFGEALILALGGSWQYSHPQGRWIVAITANNGEVVELNIFRKLKNFWDNGEEDSICYFYEMTKKLAAGTLEI